MFFQRQADQYNEKLLLQERKEFPEIYTCMKDNLRMHPWVSCKIDLQN